MSQFSRFFPFLRPYFLHMALAGVLIMGVAGLNLTLLRLAGLLWDIVTVQRNVTLMTQTILLFLGIAVAQSVMAMGQSYLTTRLSQQIIADFRTHLFRHLHTLSLSFFARRRTGDILSRLMNDVGVIQRLVTDTPIDSTKQVVTLIGGPCVFVLHELEIVSADRRPAPGPGSGGQDIRQTLESPLHANPGSNRLRVHPD